MKTFRLLSVIVIMGLLLTACGGPAQTSYTLRIATTLWPGIYPAAIAQEQGLFEKHGVKVELIYYQNYPQTYSDLAAGIVDGIDAVIGDLLLISEDTELQFVLTTDTSNGADQFIVGADVQTIADLKGKRIGVNFGTYGDLFARALLQQNGVNVSDVTFVNVQAENAGKALGTEVDAVHSYEPYTSEAVAKGGHVIATSEATPNLILGVMAFPKSIVEAHPAEIQAFVDAWYEGVDWMNAHPAEAPAVVAKGLGLTPEDIWFEGDKVFTLAETQALMKPGSNEASVYFTTQRYIDFLTTAGILTSPVKPGDLIAPAFVNK